jgi:hypothetical protein
MVQKHAGRLLTFVLQVDPTLFQSGKIRRKIRVNPRKFVAKKFVRGS